MDLEKIKTIFAGWSHAVNEDGDFPEDWYNKISSYNRFRRNQTLMNKALNDEIVDNKEPIPTEEQRKLQENQFNGLLAYKEKVDKEIVTLEENHKAVKNRIMERSKKFAAYYKSVQVSRPLPNSAYVDQLAEKYYQELKAQAQNKKPSEYKYPIRYRPYGRTLGSTGCMEKETSDNTNLNPTQITPVFLDPAEVAAEAEDMSRELQKAACE